MKNSIKISEISDWNEKAIEACYNLESGLFATLHPNQNIVCKAQNAGQSSELKRKFTQRGKDPNFSKEACLSNTNWSLGYYCDLQSIESAQAIAWSTFGLVSDSTSLIKYNWMLDFFKCLDLAGASADDAQFFFWRKLPSATKPSNLCPECDVMIATQNTLTVILCYWNNIQTESNANLIKEQIKKIDAFLFDEQKFNSTTERTFNILLVDQSTDIQKEDLQADLNYNFSTTTWNTLCGFKSHPLCEEIQRYYQWKCKHTKPQVIAGNRIDEAHEILGQD